MVREVLRDRHPLEGVHHWDVEEDIGLSDLITMRESGLLTIIFFLAMVKSHLFLFILLQNKLVEEMLKMKAE